MKLTLTINIINGWNRLAVGFGVFTDPAAVKAAVQAMTNRCAHQSRRCGAGLEQMRSKLRRVAYRMLGSVADTEDIVREDFIPLMKADRADVREPEAFLTRTVTRLCLDQLKSARHQRETYIGTWLPDPLVEAEQEEDVTLPDACPGEAITTRAGCISSP